MLFGKNFQKCSHLAVFFGNVREIYIFFARVIFFVVKSTFPREGPASKRYAQVLFEDLRVLFEDYKISEILIDFALF